MSKSKLKAHSPTSETENKSYLESPASFLTSYPMTVNEVGVLTVEPYKSMLLPHWRFRTPEVAQTSSTELWASFQQFGKTGDFIGMDMARKFIQMGMTRAKRYANHKGGKKYSKDCDGKKTELPKSQTHSDKKEKEEASLIFRGVWQRCKTDGRYNELKQQFLEDRRELKKHNVARSG